MKSFCIESYLDDIHSSFPAAPERPVVGITANYSGCDATLRDRYYKQVAAAGGVPVIIPPVNDKEVIINTLDRIDGLILSGGGDYNPLWCGEEPSPRLHAINAERDGAELLITRLAYDRQIPMLGICRGIQTLAMALGGRVVQDIDGGAAGENEDETTGGACREDTCPVTGVKHSQDADRSEPTHSVNIRKDSCLYGLYKSEKIYVNSFHHQAVVAGGEISGDKTAAGGKRFRVVATAADGVVEAIESNGHKPVMGVQWHPEWLGDDGLPLFVWIVEQAELFRKAKAIHRRILTLDTHCDTPMFFPQGIRFETRDPRILVDMHKMTEGRLDAVTMVAYLPQPGKGEEFSSKVAFGAKTPKDYADLIFDKIGNIVEANSRYIGLARTPEQLYANKRTGRKSIVLGIENGIALNHDIANVGYFARRGITYITLCHNGDNDICDSARGSATHGGVSDFGKTVIEEMNRQGVMVDMSHAAESSFYDALEISRKPIVCSHSNCKALCDVPRNLTDDQLRALAAKGGVAHVTLYHGFLRNDGAEASIMDAVNHLEHAIKIMGVEHVGLGTDFDGDGGVCGIADASEAINFTLELLRRRFNEQDIEKIWGGNWLRVMKG